MTAAAHSAAAWTEQRSLLRDSRARCLATVADALGYSGPEALPVDVRRAIAMHGHECYQVALAYGVDDDYAEFARREMPTLPALPPTRVGRRGLSRRG